MNQHDAQKMANLLHGDGLAPVEASESADVVVIHTCSIREKAEHKLYSELGRLLERKLVEPGLVVGVGGCVAQQEGQALLKRFPKLDFVFGPQNLFELPELVRGARAGARAGGRPSERAVRTDYPDEPQARFALPEMQAEFATFAPGRAFVTVMEGCDLFCSYCVVPRTRGREVSRSSAQILAEIRRLAELGVSEVTLLGQTVNAYGRPRPGMAAGELPFAELLARVAEVPGIRRIRFTSPHPSFVSDDLVAAYRDLPALCPHLHLPVQSGSSRVLAAMNRRYDREEYLAIVTALRAARPDIALTTDWIVAFPTESEEDFEASLELLREVRFTDSFSFKYSERPGTPAERRGLGELGAAEAQARLARLQSLQDALTLEAHGKRVGETTTVLVEGAHEPGSVRFAAGVQRFTGRDPQNRLVHFTAEQALAPGSYARVAIDDCTRHALRGRLASVDG
jgi:tRNA-2-methylthio-N6-dimethylallyladenosine synthase